MATQRRDLGSVVGASAGFGRVTASVEDGDAPAVTVSATGPDTAKDIAFTFAGLSNPEAIPDEVIDAMFEGGETDG